MIKLEINNCKSFGFEESSLKTVVTDTFSALQVDNVEIEIDFVDALAIQKLNRQYRKIDKPTDVLSFPQAPVPQKIRHLGSIVIAPEIVKEKDEEIDDVIKHGILHLLGFDHEVDQDNWDKEAKKINCNL